MKPGVGYIIPIGDRTQYGWTIPRSVEITAPRGSAEERAQLTALLGPVWMQGAGEMHSSDHRRRVRRPPGMARSARVQRSAARHRRAARGGAMNRKDAAASDAERAQAADDVRAAIPWPAIERGLVEVAT